VSESAKSFPISKRQVWEAYKRVKANRGAAGVDVQTIEQFEGDLYNNLYKLWNRLASASYMPCAVRRVEIPKANGGMRPLGIPTVADRIAQTVVKQHLEPKLEEHFHEDSYGYRPGKSARQALARARRRCWDYAWVVDLDIKGFFDTIDHELLMRALHKHTSDRWVLLYVRRWLEAPVELANGQTQVRVLGTPQGGVISPLLANLFLHYEWRRTARSAIIDPLPIENPPMPLSFDPAALPVLSIDDHLPAIPTSELTADALRRRFKAPPNWSPEIKVEHLFSERELTQASVLVPLVQRDNQTTLLLTQRTDHLHDHPGQISFPGGRAEPEDIDAVATAMREAEEEIGLHARHIEVLGSLPTYTTGTGFIVTPVVALIEPPFTIEIDPFEVAEVFEVPLAFLMSPANHRRHGVEFGGARREFLSMPWSADEDAPRQYFIWGATAAMLRNFYRFLAA